MERTFDFITDTCCGMPQEYIEAHGVTVLPLGYTIAGETYGGIEGKQLPPKEFYRLLREGNVCHTFQVTAEQAKTLKESVAKAVTDAYVDIREGKEAEEVPEEERPFQQKQG